MLPAQPAKLMRIHISESDQFAGKPLYEAIVAKCRELKIAGATVLRGLEGYGETAEMHKSHLTHHYQPIVITIVDSPAKLEQLAPVVESMMGTGVLAVSDVRMVRMQKQAGSE
jgi:PII-like signaling protein